MAAPAAPEPPATPRLDAMLARVRELTAASGERSRLAEFLGVPPPRLSEYLAQPPRRRPNGETTLQLLAWLDGAGKNITQKRK